MPTSITKLLVALLGLAVMAAAAPADAAAKKSKKAVAAAAAAKNVPARYRDKSVFPPGPVYFAGEYMGDDPDPFIRFMLQRDIGAKFGGEP